MDVSQCRSCGASIVWVVSSNDKAMPVEPATDGNLVLDDTSGRAHVARIAGLFDGGKKRYRSHFVTCPHADTHRKRK